jgi:hypothetical protein
VRTLVSIGETPVSPEELFRNNVKIKMEHGRAGGFIRNYSGQCLSYRGRNEKVEYMGNGFRFEYLFLHS